MLFSYAVSVLGSGILAFGLYHVHSFSNITEGGILGLTLLLQHWLNISPALSGFVLNVLCYAIGWKLLGGGFLKISLFAAASFSAIYAICEQFPPLWPQLAQMPLLAAVVGALFVGVGVGLCVWVGSAPSGDDSLSMAMSKLTGIPIQWAYLAGDLLVLGLSLTYIPAGRLLYSLLTVLISGQVIGLVQKLPRKKSGTAQEGLAAAEKTPSNDKAESL